ncbi:3-methyladenine DNA glycosylase/8-oxoguanine DNA glycosylase [Kitasatospora sp. MAP12-15]|uniref:hypothetical protein n=1 Tax=unclassified Kitasatospora TaxID=2633591 RepID=UPI002476A965|nr:hypothetical protein [Kitasatospora sp. MAP12-44]MDH6113301.1 3-methyladenine DNA glycosylase/8-oxoguanine DNA glycosylase [Kitasatospora sp. MAP12-44]
MAPTALVTDHPAWQQQPDGSHTRLMASLSGVWLARWTDNGLAVSCIDGSEESKPHVTEVTADQLPPRANPELTAALAELGIVQRLANPSLWDAVTTAILRQVVRAGQARILYRRWCATYGRTYVTEAGTLTVAPDPQTVLTLDEAEFKTVGALFHRTALLATATAYLEHADAWSALDPTALANALDAVPRIGPWTAAAAASDFTGDFSIYPHGDLAVRTWADRAAPGATWPATDKAFAAAWTASADNSRQLHALTLLTLAWGSNASTQRHGGPAQLH